MNSIDKLSEIFSKFPGIGPRQAKRFVYFLLTRNGDYSGELVKAIQNLRKEIVQRDIDFEAVEKSGSYKGYYFVLGGVVPILEKEPEKRIRNKELRIRIKKGEERLKEIILAMNANLDGENTAEIGRASCRERV